MGNAVFWWFLGALYTFVVLGAGVAVGYHVKYLRKIIEAALVDEPTVEFEGPAIIEAKKPSELWQDRFEEDADSAVVVALTPKQLQAQRDKKLDEELDQLTGTR